MKYSELKDIIADMDALATSKETILGFFAYYDNIQEGRIYTMKKIIHIEWYLSSGRLILGFNDDKIGYTFINKFGGQTEGILPVGEVLKRLKMPQLKGIKNGKIPRN